MAKLGLLTTASALLFVAIGASPVNAAGARSTSCSTTGASGSLTISGWESQDKGIPSVVMKVNDTLSDGHHPSIRLGVTYYRGGITYYPWHANYDGYGTSKSFSTYVPEGSDGITAVWVDVARYEGSEQLNICLAKYIS
ncbi:hypothetical protein ACIBI8_00825 [Streptomyces sp. NPDC050529]|uniref:hypothetical protein n=1 Tax=unclassified Streptomyces TaxID=2593676 RepID=UPI002DD88618|nr:hypothetical protein [Streptomyces sp. NBC_01022]WRZ84134.1 hypothetical protein OG316_29670 [Streptomyces sp. NBC_01022]